MQFAGSPALSDENFNVLGEGEFKEEDKVDLAWKRWNFMDSSNAKAMSRLANAVSLYNMNPGADRFEQADMKSMMTQTLSDWVSSGKTTEGFLATFVQDRPGRMSEPSGTGAWQG